MDLYEVVWRTVNGTLAVTAGVLLYRQYAARWRRLARHDRETGLGIMWLMVTVVVAAVETTSRDIAAGPRTAAVTVGLALIVVGEIRREMSTRREPERSEHEEGT